MSPAEGKKEELRKSVSLAARRLCEAEIPVRITRPKGGGAGLCTAAAFPLAAALGRNPAETAILLTEGIALPEGDTAFAENGYINFSLRPDFMIKALDRNFTIPKIKLPPLESPEFERVYPIARLADVLRQRKCFCGGELIFNEDEEIRLLWSVFFDAEAYLLAAAQRFYDLLGMGERGTRAAASRYVLLGNAVNKLREYGSGENHR